MREAFLNMTENSDAINEKADVFDNIQFNIFIQQKHQHELEGKKTNSLEKCLQLTNSVKMF